MDSPPTAGRVLDRRWPTPETGNKNGPLLSCGLSPGQPLVRGHRINLASEFIFVQQHTKPGLSAFAFWWPGYLTGATAKRKNARGGGRASSVSALDHNARRESFMHRVLTLGVAMV